VSLLHVDNLTIRYGRTTAVSGLSFSLRAGECVGLVGESGSGKTQTALALLGLLPADAKTTGQVSFAGTELLSAGERALNKLRAECIAMIFQDPMQALNPYVRIGPQLRRILVEHGIASGKAADARVIQMLRRVGLADAERQYRAYPHQLSGGMRQRVMIASALLAEPDLLVADEPTSSLDVTVQAQILELLQRLREDTALLLITHDLGVVAGHCDRMLVLEQGRLVEEGLTRDIFAAPRHAHTRRLLAAAPRVERTDVPQPVHGEEVLSIRGASVSYSERGPRGGRLHAVREVDLVVHRGETLAVVGESGSGKSSLVRAALGLIPMQSGCVSYCGKALDGLAQTRAVSVRRDLQLVFQDPVGSLNPQMCVANIVAEPLSVHEPAVNVDERRRRVTEELESVGLSEEYLQRFPHELSGGQAQRVAIARGWLMQPRVLDGDETVAALDGSARDQVLALLKKAQGQSGLSILFITHDLAVVRAISHRILVMYMGRLVELADNETLFARTRHPYTRALINAVPAPDPGAAGCAPLYGEAPSILSPPTGCAFHPRCTHAHDLCSAERPVARLLGDTMVACHRAEEM